MSADPWLALIAGLHVAVWAWALVMWRRNRDRYVDAVVFGDSPDERAAGRLNFKMHLLLLIALPAVALVYAGAALAEG